MPDGGGGLGRLINLRLIPHQADMLEDTTSDTIIDVAGYGSGKTMGIVIKALDLAARNYPVWGMVTEPTFPMVRKILLPAFRQFLNKHGIPWRYNKNEHVLSVRLAGKWCQIQLDSVHDPERLKGPNLAYAIIDEAGLVDPEVWENLPARVRHEDAKCLQFIAVGTPEGFGEFYEWAEGMWNDADRGLRNVLRAETYDNIFLPGGPESFIRKRLSHLDENDLEQYVRGRFVAKGSRVYRAFTRDNNHARRPVGDGRIGVGADFNVSRMCWTTGIETTGDGGHVFGELVRYDTTTEAQGEALSTYLRDRIRRDNRDRESPSIAEIRTRTTIYADPSAKNRGTRAEKSDVEILRSMGYTVQCNHTVIPVKDRTASVNWRLRSRLLTVDVGECPQLVRSLEQQGRDKNGEPEKRVVQDDPDVDLSGPPDALGYWVWARPTWRVTMPTGNRVSHEAYV